MLISREKRKTNIAEYILYMWQVEDTLRAFEFDTGRLEKELIGKYDQPAHVKEEVKEWYENLAALMINENVKHSGHLQFLKNVVYELYNFHLSLLNQPDESNYSGMFATILPLIREMNAKQKWTSENEIETCLNAVYIFMMMRLGKKPVSEETEKAINLFIRFLAELSSRYRIHEEKLDRDQNRY